MPIYDNIFLMFKFILNNNYLLNLIIIYKLNIILGIGDWGLGIGDWGFGPKHQNPKPKPQTPKPNFKKKKKKKINKIKN